MTTTKRQQCLVLCKQWYVSFKYTHFYNSTVAISTDKMSLSYEYSCIHFCLLIAGTILLSFDYHGAEYFIPMQTTKAYNFFLGYFSSLTEYNYGNHDSNNSWHHTRELSVHNCIFAMFSEFCEESFQHTTDQRLWRNTACYNTYLRY